MQEIKEEELSLWQNLPSDFNHLETEMTTDMNGRLRFGIICDGVMLTNWQAQSVRILLGVDKAKLALIIVEPHTQEEARRTSFGRFLFRAYDKLLVKPKALRTQSLNQLFSNISRVGCVPEGDSSDYPASQDVDAIALHDLDFILDLGHGIPRGRILNAARYGVWSFRYGGETNHRGFPPGFWEIYHGDATTTISLMRIGEKPELEVELRRGNFRTQNASYAKNLQLILSESSRWPAQACIDIIANQFPTKFANHLAPTTLEIPGNLETIQFFVKLLLNRLKETYRLLFRYSFWNIGLVKAPIEKFLDNDFKPAIDWLPRPRKGEFNADPFGITASSGIQMFYENLDYRHPKGTIYSAKVAEGSFAGKPWKVIESPVHLSYPQLIEYKNEIFCVPEANRSKEIAVYKAMIFPYEWKKFGVLLTNVMAIDTTVFQYKGTWWMMFTDRQRGGDANLYAYHAPDFWGPWNPHLNNPIKSDVQSSRPGGTPFYHDGLFYRPAQDCSRTGGGRIVINRIERLTPSQFEETPVAMVEPDPKGPYPNGLHTLSMVGGSTLVDGKRFEFSRFGLINNILKGIRRTLELD